MKESWLVVRTYGGGPTLEYETEAAAREAAEKLARVHQVICVVAKVVGTVGPAVPGVAWDDAGPPDSKPPLTQASPQGPVGMPEASQKKVI